MHWNDADNVTSLGVAQKLAVTSSLQQHDFYYPVLSVNLTGGANTIHCSGFVVSQSSSHCITMTLSPDQVTIGEKWLAVLRACRRLPLNAW